MKKNIAVVGLGLMGGSLAKTIKAKTKHGVIGFDRSKDVLNQAMENGSIDEIGTELTIQNADILLVSLYPEATVEFVSKHIDSLKKGCLIVDMCGVKQYVCDCLAPLALQHDVCFIGGHPMAGREFSGFQYSTDTLFNGASMLLIPTESSKQCDVQAAEEFFYSLGFGKVVCTTAANHDKMIAFTSQLAHVVSSAYIKSPEATQHIGYSAGSYKDLTRVARLNEDMWTELFLMNRDPLVREIDEIILHLTEYRNAIASRDDGLLHKLLKEGRERKESLG